MSATVTSSGGRSANRPIAESTTAYLLDGRCGGLVTDPPSRADTVCCSDAEGTCELSAQPPETASHRPSRRGVIVAAAIKVFSSQGFGDAKIHDIAHEAGVAPTAVYYHFDGKPDLFEAALRHVLGSITSVVIGDPVRRGTGKPRGAGGRDLRRLALARREPGVVPTPPPPPPRHDQPGRHVAARVRGHPPEHERSTTSPSVRRRPPAARPSAGTRPRRSRRAR